MTLFPEFLFNAIILASLVLTAVAAFTLAKLWLEDRKNKRIW